MMQMMTRTAIHPLNIAVALGAAFLVWGLVLVYASGPAWAATITVNSLNDDADGADVECTLREAITSANTNTASGTATGECAAGSATENDVINFALPGTAPWTVTLTAELPPLTSNIEIDGPGDDQLTVRRDDTAENFRIFTVSGDTTVVTISGMTVSGGNVDDTEGGGILIADSGTLTVTDSTIIDNFTEDGGGGIGIDPDTDGTLTVIGSTIIDNTAEFDNGGGIRNAGTGTVEVTDSTISGNFSGHEGGALANDGDGTMTVADSTMGPDNSSDSEGGGLYNASDSTLTVTGSTVSDNSTDSDGGGIFNGGTLKVTDSTISGNTAYRTTAGQFSYGGEGGGISSSTELPDADPANDPDDTTTITNSTISGNTADGEDAIGGGVYNSFGLTVIEHSTITDNTAPDGAGSGVASRGNEEYASTEALSSIISANEGTDVDFLTDFGTPANTFDSNGYNLIGDGNATSAFNQTGDQRAVADPGLGPLADNGGPTQTHELLTGSPAIDKGPPSTACPPPDTDQRGVQRPQDGDADSTAICDIGSFELEVQEPENQAPSVRAARGGECGPASDMRGTINLALSDPDTQPEDLTLSATSSDRSVVPQKNLLFGGGTDASRTLTVTAVKGSGTSTLRVRASDGELQSPPLVVVVLSGTSVNNTLSGSANTDMIFARKGADSLGGRGSNDLLCGGNGKDRLRAGAGADHFGGGYGREDAATDFDASEGDSRRGIERF